VNAFCRVINGSTDVLEHILTDKDCDVDPVNKIARATPLHIAVQLEPEVLRNYVVESLLEAGADVTCVDTSFHAQTNLMLTKRPSTFLEQSER